MPWQKLRGCRAPGILYMNLWFMEDDGEKYVLTTIQKRYSVTVPGQATIRGVNTQVFLDGMTFQKTTDACQLLLKVSEENCVCDQSFISMNKTDDPWEYLCDPPFFWGIFAALVLSLTCNIICCLSKCLGNRTCGSKIRQSQSPQQMQENPIYGNVSYMQTSTTALTEIQPPKVTLSCSSLMDQLSSSYDSQSKTPDCYANLSLKAPKTKESACSSSQVQYSVVFQSEELRKENEANADSVTAVSDVYASVQTKRTDTGDKLNSGEAYANHI
ncbi:uncharacterized protein LOC129186655 isoform X2 [Dunckerocampus dactyliophorus]|uniref:uncharacterized protein LOC129186655 isoform X2 n=1 Tax=Dunckerocampus dactyliophorus TaxID=161453 RepID=UPI002404CB36|nr:uncharacterized protein LOC129186655 isoform X2 [Dunckerocampus dactyliophorus]